MQHLIDGITHLIATLGYPGVLLLMSLESACIPVPSEAIMPFAGAQITAPTGSFHPNIWVLTMVGALGNLLGSILAYWVGHTGGRPFLDKYGKYVLIRKRDLDKSDAFFHKYGDWTVFFSRWLPIVRTFISLPAGIARMNFPQVLRVHVYRCPAVLLFAGLGGNKAGTALEPGPCLAAKGGFGGHGGTGRPVRALALASPAARPGEKRRRRNKSDPGIVISLSVIIIPAAYGIIGEDQVQRRTPVRAIAPPPAALRSGQ